MHSKLIWVTSTYDLVSQQRADPTENFPDDDFNCFESLLDVYLDFEVDKRYEVEMGF